MKLLTGDITKIETDAIVNAASPDLASVSRASAMPFLPPLIPGPLLPPAKNCAAVLWVRQ